MDYQQIALQQKLLDKENLYPKVSVEKKNNNPLINERNTVNLSKFCQRLENIEKKILLHNENTRNIEYEFELFPQW